ncbi:helix-turn-helix transcriptional regulator [Thalassobacillus pellis]|uniref:helix-turn-helix transcriptional regulator n=1 Tax=Thalassobacillus pellis TaxID=748008 RepID=UPI0019603652|nr:helix-turn-helix domain-containing protein [Thalassobacillus pellis]MBM7552427.1 DNA-binding XRE family transcriptional regulator [Thalassobacillus pellis]
MDKEQLIRQISKKIKLIRVEKSYTQNKMADILGISKKTLVQIEKERTEASWTTIVAVCALFQDSETLRNMLGEDPMEVIETVAHEYIERPRDKTLGGKIWWNNIEERQFFTLQQNLISKHYRIIDNQHYRWYSSFDEQDAMEKLMELEHK